MARRSIVQQDLRVPGDPDLSAYPDSGEPDAVPARGRGSSRRGHWSGGGGRWLVWVGRVVLWALIVVIVVNGVRAPFERFTQATGAAGLETTPTGSGFPVEQASSFATQFAIVYLNFDAARQAERAGRLAPFLPEGVDAQFGWDGSGQMTAGALQPFGVEVIDAQNAVVTLAFQSGNRLMRLSVPVYYSGEGFVVSARPAVLPAPNRPALPQVAEPDRDDTTADELRLQLDGFFKAYAAGDKVALARYVAVGKTLADFGGALTYVRLEDLIVPPGGTTREVIAVVMWQVPMGATPAAQATPADPGTEGGKLTQAYRLTVEKQGGRWFVTDIRGASRSVG